MSVRLESQILFGDCLTQLDAFDAGVFDMVLCDPPYGTTFAHWDSVIDFNVLWTQLLRVTKPSGVFCFFSQQPFTSRLVLSNPDMFKEEIIWEKEKGVNFITAKKKVMKAHENVIVFAGPKSTYNPQMVPGEPYSRTVKNCTAGSTHEYVPAPTAKVSDGMRYPKSVQRFARDAHRDKENHHPTAKPVDLCRWLIRTYSNPDDIILDPTCGGGSSGKAADRENRRYVLIENDPKFYAMSVDAVKAV